jgi:hypothetical protein
MGGRKGGRMVRPGQRFVRTIVKKLQCMSAPAAKVPGKARQAWAQVAQPPSQQSPPQPCLQ